MPSAPQRAPSVLSCPSRGAVGCEIRRVLAHGGRRARDEARDGARGRTEGSEECSDLALVAVSVLMFEGAWQRDCASGSAHAGLVKWDRVRALHNGGMCWTFSSESTRV